ncbi:hypothetical protein GCM10009546_05050 [Actinomadura livida]|uniref:Restriction endonuclease domain-containing protein n=1 Tax=Actinomadura livida TaxID=79909 RepID=A0ABP3NM84_9ACTN|nr:hypothetical protein GCM10010208_53860 [Actinomadura livida]
MAWGSAWAASQTAMMTPCSSRLSWSRISSHGYAAADIPLYLLIDRLDGKATIFSEPRGDEYAHSTSVVLGEDLPIPAPLEGVLPTRDF